MTEAQGAESDNTEGILTLAREGSITLVGNILGKIIGFTFVVIVTKAVSPGTFGVYSLGLGVVLFVKSIADISIHRSIDYFIPIYNKEGDNSKIRFVFFFSLILSLIGTSLAAIFLWWGSPLLASLFSEPRLSTAVPILALTLPLLALRDVIIKTFVGMKNLKHKSLLNELIFPSGRIFFFLLLLFVGYKLSALLFGYLLSLILTAIIAILILWREYPWLFRTHAKLIPPKQIISYSLPLVFVGVIYSTVNQIDYFIIGYYENTSASDLAIYKVSTMLGMNLVIFERSLAPILKPTITEAQSDFSLLLSRYETVTKWTLIFTLPASITLLLAPSQYLSFLFTSEYSTGSVALTILVLGYLVSTMPGPEGSVLEGLGHTRLTLVNSILMLGSNTLVGLLLIPRFGIIGAAIGTSTGIIIVVVAGVIEIWHLTGGHPFSLDTFRVLLAGILPLGFGFIFRNTVSDNFLIIILLPIIVIIGFLASLALFKPFSDDDKVVLGWIDEKLGTNISKSFSN